MMMNGGWMLWNSSMWYIHSAASVVESRPRSLRRSDKVIVLLTRCSAVPSCKLAIICGNILFLILATPHHDYVITILPCCSLSYMCMYSNMSPWFIYTFRSYLFNYYSSTTEPMEYSVDPRVSPNKRVSCGFKEDNRCHNQAILQNILQISCNIHS